MLAIDTATPSVVVGVVSTASMVEPATSGATSRVETTTLASRVLDDQRRHAEVLTTLMREVLAEAGVSGADLDAVVVGCGPGPFTGLRVGLATAAAYADALNIPAYGVCTLDAIAAATGETDDVLVVTDARRREVYWARYGGGERVAGPEVCAPDAVDRGAAQIVAGTPGFTDRYELPVSTTTVPTPAALVAVAAVAAQGEPDSSVGGSGGGDLTPLYLRRPDAVLLADQRRKSLL